MPIQTLDPISMNEITDLNNAPFIVEGQGADALKIYFENEANLIAYLEIPLYAGQTAPAGRSEPVANQV